MFSYENECISHGKKLIAGMDEAGRGPLAGPVCVAMVIMPLEKDNIISGVNDSKKLTAKVREKLYEEIVSKALAYRVEFVDEKQIDNINILNATKKGMCNCIENIDIKPDIVLIDAVKVQSEIETTSIIKGDSLSYQIACASIIAKVTRDRLMVELDKKYPDYNFKKHKGYPTKEHIELLKKYGKSEIHRESFIRKFVS